MIVRTVATALLVPLSLVACAAPPSPDGPVTVSLPTAESASPRASSVASAPTARASASVDPVAGPVDPPAKPTSITVVEGTPQTLPGGTTISAGKMIYAHLSNDGNLSMCEVTVTRAGVTETKTLEREGPMKFTLIAGVRVGLDGVDPYHQPSSAFLVVGD